MSDFEKKFASGLNNMQHAPGYLPAAKPTPVPAGQSIWQSLLGYLKGPEQATALPTTQMKPEPTPVNPYMNYADKVTGKPYR